MTFTDDLDAVRARIGFKTIHRLTCDCGDRLVTISSERARDWAEGHWDTHGLGHRGVWTHGPARIRIKRLRPDQRRVTVYRWLVKDAERPHGFGYARTHDAAIKLVDLILAGQHAVVHDEYGFTVAYRIEPTHA